MAHGDYDCCAVCDCKMRFSYDAQTKATICCCCTANLAERGVICHGVSELLAWMESGESAEVKQILDSVGFSKCFYPNAVDDAYAKLTANPQ